MSASLVGSEMCIRDRCCARGNTPTSQCALGVLNGCCQNNAKHTIILHLWDHARSVQLPGKRAHPRMFSPEP
eukprot:14335698-Alexandrium_andersonii.AAC.1